MQVFVCVLFAAAAVMAEGPPSYPAPAPAPAYPSYPAPAPAPAYPKAAYPEPEEPAKYEFAYTVQANENYQNLDFGHNENRDDKHTSGYYHVALPDGRIQRVSYTVNGDEGYVADVRYEGEAKAAYPAPAPKASYPAPAPKASYPAPAPQPSYPAPAPKASYPAPAPQPSYPH